MSSLKLLTMSVFCKNHFIKCKDISFIHSLKRCLATPSTSYAGFARTLALGRIDMSWICPYATMDSEEDLEKLNLLSDNVAKFFSENVDSAKMDETAHFDPDVLQGLKDMGLFGQQIPAEYGGLGLSNVEYARMQEEISIDGATALMLDAHQNIGLKGILLAGTEEQKKKYLPSLATGESVAAFCLTEPFSGSDPTSVRAKAVLSEDGKNWIINGEKIWITNGGIADVMTVFAKTEIEGSDGNIVEKMTAFLVERSFGGVTSGEPVDKMGVRAVNTCSVSFENTPVPIENVLGNPGEGFSLAMSVLNEGRFSIGTNVAGQLKRMVAMVTKHLHKRIQFGKRLSEFGIIQEKLFEMTKSIYAIESMAYMTAGQMDVPDADGKPKDCSIEAAMVKIYSSEVAWQYNSECLQMFGGIGYLKKMPIERMLRDARVLPIFEGTNEILRLFVSLSMLQYAGDQLRHRLDLIWSGHLRERLRFFMDEFREWRHVNKDHTFTPAAAFGLRGPSATKTWLHPGLHNAGRTLEASTQIFGKRVYNHLKMYGKEIHHEQVALKTFADVAINLYAMASVIARCNKAKILDLRHSDHERLLATSFVREKYRENSVLMQKLMTPDPFDCKSERQQVCKDIMAERRYICSHPLEVVHRHKENPIYLEQLEKIKKLS